MGRRVRHAVLCFEAASVIASMNKVECLKDSLGVSERGQDYEHVEYLMTSTENIESSPVPPLRYLVEVSQFQVFFIRICTHITAP
jgi:hypothetical protein